MVRTQLIAPQCNLEYGDFSNHLNDIKILQSRLPSFMEQFGGMLMLHEPGSFCGSGLLLDSSLDETWVFG